MRIHEERCRYAPAHLEDGPEVQNVDMEGGEDDLHQGNDAFDSQDAPADGEQESGTDQGLDYFPFASRSDAYDYIYHTTALTPVQLRQNYLRFRQQDDAACSLPMRQSAWVGLLGHFPIMSPCVVPFDGRQEGDESLFMHLPVCDLFSKIVQLPEVGLMTQQSPRLAKSGVMRTEFNNSPLMYQHPALCSHAEYVLSASTAPQLSGGGPNAWPVVCLSLGDVFRRDDSHSRTVGDIAHDGRHRGRRGSRPSNTQFSGTAEYYRVCGLSRIANALLVEVRCRRLVSVADLLRINGEDGPQCDFIREVAASLSQATLQQVFVECNELNDFTAPAAQPMVESADASTADELMDMLEGHEHDMVSCLELCVWKYVRTAQEILCDDCGIGTVRGMWRGGAEVRVHHLDGDTVDQFESLRARGCTTAIVVADGVRATVTAGSMSIAAHTCCYDGVYGRPWDDVAELLWTFVRPFRTWGSSVRHITEGWDGDEEGHPDSQFRSRSRMERCVAYSLFGDGFKTGQPVVGIYIRVQNMALAASKLRRNVIALGYAKGKVKLIHVLGKLYDELVRLERGVWVTWADGTRAFTRYILVQTKLDSKERYPLCGCREAARAINGCISCAHAYREGREVLLTDVTHRILRDIRTTKYGRRRWTDACAIVDDCRKERMEGVSSSVQISARLQEAGYEDLERVNENCFYGGRWGYRLSFNPFVQSPPCVFHNLCTSSGLMNQVIQFLEDALSLKGARRLRARISAVGFSGSFRGLRRLMSPAHRGIVGRLTGMQTSAFIVYLPFCARSVLDTPDSWKHPQDVVQQMGGGGLWKEAMNELVCSASYLVYLTFRRALPMATRADIGAVGSRFVRLYGMLVGSEKVLQAQKPHDCAFHHEEIGDLYSNPVDSSTAVEESKHRYAVHLCGPG